MTEKVKNEKSASKFPPMWAWLFIVACAAIPIVAIGGAFPMAIGFGGVAGCYQASRDETKSLQMRVLYCVGITVIAWVIFVALLYFVFSVI